MVQPPPSVRAGPRVAGFPVGCPRMLTLIVPGWKMGNMTFIRLKRLAEVIGLDVRTAQRWAAEGAIRGTNLGRGRGNGVVLDREQALEACAVMLLRRAGVPMQRIRETVRQMRREGRAGRDFLAVGSAGRAVLL